MRPTQPTQPTRVTQIPLVFGAPENPEGTLSVDSTLFTVDSTDITVDQTLI